MAVYIPQELSQRNLPFSYKFYDPILSIIQDELPHETKQFFSVQRKYLLERVYRDDFNRELFEKLGLRSPFDEKKKNLAFKYTQINENKNVNFMESEHTWSLQVS